MTLTVLDRGVPKQDPTTRGPNNNNNDEMDDRQWIRPLLGTLQIEILEEGEEGEIVPSDSSIIMIYPRVLLK